MRKLVQINEIKISKINHAVHFRINDEFYVAVETAQTIYKKYDSKGRGRLKLIEDCNMDKRFHGMYNMKEGQTYKSLEKKFLKYLYELGFCNIEQELKDEFMKEDFKKIL